jgi:hypothetical protein
MQPLIRDRPVSDVVPEGDDVPAVERLPLVAWRCDKLRRDGRICGWMLAEYATDGPLVLRRRCEKCGHWNDLVR